METSHKEAVATYFSQFEKQVAKEMLKRPKVQHLLKTLSLEVFVPTNWTGPTGIRIVITLTFKCLYNAPCSVSSFSLAIHACVPHGDAAVFKFT